MFTGFNDVEVTGRYRYLQIFQCLAVSLSKMQKPHTLQSWDLKASSFKAAFLSPAPIRRVSIRDSSHSDRYL